MRHGRLAAMAGTLLVILVAAPSAAASHNRPNVPPGLDTQLSSAHFLIHYDTDTYSAAQAAALRDDLEESHAKLVAGGGGTPNAGLATPPDDGDAKTDVYVGVAVGCSVCTSGGFVFGDPGHFSSYMFMTPNLSRSATRFRSAHEYMHVIQHAYYGNGGTMFSESTANWASEWALPDVDPLDSFFGNPHRPLDCATQACGSGYWQWSFMWRLSQRYGVGIVKALLEEVGNDCPLGCSQAQDRAILADVVAAQPDDATLGGLYAAYARHVWAPERWSTGPLATTAMQSIHNVWGDPDATQVTALPDSAFTNVTVDHLATRYVRWWNHPRFDPRYEPTGPNDTVRVDVTRPAGQPAPFHALWQVADGTWVDSAALAGTGGFLEVPADPASVRRVVLPLTNSSFTDGLPFSYRLRYQHGAPAAPPNDLQANPEPVVRGVEETTNNVYAGGRGNVTEATSCPPAADATRGVWYRFTTEGYGMHTYSAQGSDFTPVVALYRADDGSFAGCGVGDFSSEQPSDTTYDVYVGRHPNANGFGSAAKLAVNGPPPGPPALDTTLPASGSVVNTRRPTFAGTAGTRAADGTTITVKIWAGTVPDNGPPTRTLTTERTGSTWQVAATFDLGNGTYVWRAEQDSAHGTGTSPNRLFDVSVPNQTTNPGTGGTTGGPGGGSTAIGPGGTLQPGPIGGEPVTDDVPFVSAECRRARTSRTLATRGLTTAKRALRRARTTRSRRLARKRVARAQKRVRTARANVRRFCP